MNSKIDVKKWDIYWMLTIIREVDLYKNKYRTFECKCDCWNVRYVLMNNMRRWLTLSCWCIRSNNNIQRQKTHWKNWTRIHRIFFNIRDRCNNPKNNRFYCYGWRWIKCQWNSFEEFYSDMIHWYNDDLQIDRIDVNWNYYKENCRWVDIKTQARNKRNNVYYKWKTLAECREDRKMSKWVFDNLRYKRKLSLEEIFW